MTPEQEIALPEYWQQNAERLIFSADALIEKLRTIQQFPEKGDIMQWSSNVRSLLEANYMLLGFAAENAIKGYSIYKFISENGQLISSDLQYLLKSVWKVKSGHNILLIAKNANFQLEESEKTLLTKLQEHSVWKGRYHIPTDLSQIKQVLLPGEKDKYGPDERKLVKDLVERIGTFIRSN